MAVADCTILEISGRDSQNSFFIIGVLYAIIGLITFSGFFALFFGVFDNVFSALIGATIIGFLIGNIYRLTLISLEPNTLPRKSPLGSIVLSNFLRYFTIGAFAFFVSKCFEMLVVDLIELAATSSEFGLKDYDGSSGYMEHMMEANQSKPWLWSITLFMMVLFASPIYIRSRLKRSHQYYNLKFRRDVRLVKEQYSVYTEMKERFYQNLFNNYSELAERKMVHDVNSKALELIRSELRAKRYKEHEKLYHDYPFCTKPVEKGGNLNSSDEFASHFDPERS